MGSRRYISLTQRRLARNSKLENVARENDRSGNGDAGSRRDNTEDRRSALPIPPAIARQESDILPRGPQVNELAVDPDDFQERIITLTHGIEMTVTGRPSLASPSGLPPAPPPNAPVRPSAPPANVQPPLPPPSGRPSPNTALAPGPTPSRSGSPPSITPVQPIMNPGPAGLATTTSSTTSSSTPSPTLVPVIGLPEQAAGQPGQTDVLAPTRQPAGMDAGSTVGIAVLIIVAIALAVAGIFAMKKCMSKKSKPSPTATSRPVARPEPLDEMAKTYPQIAGQLGAIAARVENEKDDWSSPSRGFQPANSTYY